MLKLWATPWNLAHLGKSSVSNHTAASTIPRTAIGITEVHLQLNTNRFSSSCAILSSMTDYGRYQQPPQLFQGFVPGHVPRRNLPPGYPLLNFFSALEVAMLVAERSVFKITAICFGSNEDCILSDMIFLPPLAGFRGQATTPFEPKSAAFIGEVEAPSSARTKAPAHNESPQSVYGLANPENFRTEATLRKPILEIVSL